MAPDATDAKRFPVTPSPVFPRLLSFRASATAIEAMTSATSNAYRRTHVLYGDMTVSTRD
jgi:hypothetical protein